MTSPLNTGAGRRTSQYQEAVTTAKTFKSHYDIVQLMRVIARVSFMESRRLSICRFS